MQIGISHCRSVEGIASSNGTLNAQLSIQWPRVSKFLSIDITLPHLHLREGHSTVDRQTDQAD
jgi:hypothetical protein